MSIHLHLDAETFSRTPIKHGLSRYFSDPSYELLMLAYAFDDGPVQLWDCHRERIPDELREAIIHPETIIHAHNAVFEWHVLWKLSGHPVPLKRFVCSQVRAYSLGFTGYLADIQAQVSVAPDKVKLKTGKALINRFCKPAPSNHKADRYDWDTHPSEWIEFCEYCLQDVVAERELELVLRKYPETPAIEREYWLMDQRINQRGMKLDLPLVQSALKVDFTHKSRLRKKLKEMTGLGNPGSTAQFLKWLKVFHDGDVANVRKETLEAIVADYLTEPFVAEVCSLRMELNKTSNAKWKAMENAVSDDGRLRNVFQFGGAQRTQRWAGRIVQPQNLPSSNYDDQEVYDIAVDSIKTRNPDLLTAWWGDLSPLLSQSIRGAIIPEAGHDLVVSDYASIESVVLGWISHCDRLNGIFREGKDSYKDFASEYFHIPYEQVTKKQRKFAKPPVLGCGYMLGWKGLVAYAAGYGVTLSKEESKAAVTRFRDMYPEIPQFWKDIMLAVKQAINNPGSVYEVSGRLWVYMVADDMLAIVLPSGRNIYYHQPRWELVDMPWGGKDMGFTYMGQNQNNPVWTRIDAHAGKVTENVIQALARDLLADGMLRMDKTGVELVLHVHDEPVAEAEERHAEQTLAYMKWIMSTPPPWAPDMLLGSAGWIGKKYRKD